VKSLMQFVKATVLGGFFVVLPVVLAWLVVNENLSLCTPA
jgi:hypothetical protein